MKILLWETRDSKGCSLRELEKKTGLSKSTLNNIENGKTSPTFDEMEIIAAALDARITDMFESDYK